MIHSKPSNPPPQRRLVEFEDYPTFVGTRLFPRAGNLALVGLLFYALFTPLDWLLTQGRDPFGSMLFHRGLGLFSIAVMALLLKKFPHTRHLAALTLYLGILAFLLIIMGYLIYVPQLALVAFIMIFFNFGVLFIGPLLPMKHFVLGSILTIGGIAAFMALGPWNPWDYGMAALCGVPIQIFLGFAIHNSQKNMREQYEYARQNFLFSTLDTLTQLLNRRTWYEKTGQGLSRRAEMGGVASFIMLDIDHFKHFNDTWGHDCGDLVIKSVSSVLIGQTRSSDVVGRLGGEEFGILLPDTDRKGAQEIAERIRKAVEGASVIYNDQELKVTVSLGVSVTTPTLSDLEDLIKQGDICLYKAKKEGRNRVVTSGD